LYTKYVDKHYSESEFFIVLLLKNHLPMSQTEREYNL